MTRITKNVSLVTENWFVPIKRYTYDYEYGYSMIMTPTIKYVYNGAVSGGVRILGDKVSIDLAVVTIFSDGFILPIPYCDLVVKF